MASDPERPGWIADVTAGPERPRDDAEDRLYDQIRSRRTHRGGFLAEGLPTGLLQILRTCATGENVALRIVADPRAQKEHEAQTKVNKQQQRQNQANKTEFFF